jgi:hypothetical protein
VRLLIAFLIGYNPTTMRRACLSLSFWIVAVSMLSGCAYRLPAARPLSRDLLRVVVHGQEQYIVEVDTGNVKSYTIPPDGHLTLEIPSYRQSCGVYLFNVVKVGGY